MLRARELYADALVARWTGSDDPYRDLAGPPRRHRRWRRGWANHPGPAVRKKNTAQPGLLLRPGFTETLAAGIAIEITWTLSLSAAGLGGGADVWTYAQLLLWSVAVALLLAVAGWRAAEYHRTGARGTSAALAGAGLALGLIAGRFFTINADGGAEARRLPVTLVGAVNAALLIAFATALAAWAAYLAGCSAPGPVAGGDCSRWGRYSRPAWPY